MKTCKILVLLLIASLISSCCSYKAMKSEDVRTMIEKSTEFNIFASSYKRYNKVQLESLDSEEMESYFTLKALQDMKKHDKHGTTETPMRLGGLLYLHQTKNFELLSNVSKVMGSRFYVLDQNTYKTNKVMLVKLIKVSNDWSLILNSH